MLYISLFAYPLRAMLQAESSIHTTLWHVPLSAFSVEGMAFAAVIDAADAASALLACGAPSPRSTGARP